MKSYNMNQTKLEDVLKILPSGVTTFDGEKTYIDTRSVFDNKIIGYKKIEYNNRPSRANMETSEGCVLFAKMQNTHKVLLINSDNVNNIYSTGFFVLKPKQDKILSEYLYFWLNFNETEKIKDRLAHGATQKAINNSDLNNRFNIPLPDITSQKEIVKKLQRIENVLIKLKNQQDNAKLLLINVREQIFKNPPNYLLLSDVTKALYRYPTFYGFDYVPSGIPVLKISNMTDDCEFNTNKSTYDYIPDEINVKYPKTVVDKGDIVMEVRGTYIGKCALVPDFLIGANISPNTIRISINRNIIIPELFWHYTFTLNWKNQIAERTNYWKIGFGTIKSKELKSVEVPVFGLEKQKTFIHMLNRLNLIYNMFSNDVYNCRRLLQSTLKNIYG